MNAKLVECAAAQVFFTPENFALVAMLPMSQRGRDALNSLTIDKLDNTVVKPLASEAAPDSVGVPQLSKKQRDFQRKMQAIQLSAQRMAKR